MSQMYFVWSPSEGQRKLTPPQIAECVSACESAKADFCKNHDPGNGWIYWVERGEQYSSRVESEIRDKLPRWYLFLCQARGQ